MHGGGTADVIKRLAEKTSHCAVTVIFCMILGMCLAGATLRSGDRDQTRNM